MRKRKAGRYIIRAALLLTALLLTGGCGQQKMSQVAGTLQRTQEDTEAQAAGMYVRSLEEIPEFSGEPYVVVNQNEPGFDEADYSDQSYESYGELDELGRCTPAIANIGPDLMPTEKRGAIGQVKPTGWHTTKYDSVDGKYLFNRCHLIGYQLTAENANERNLITGTRYLNVEGMLPFENMTADYIKETGNHVLYRVTPVFEGDNLVASGVQMEAMSVEDDGEGICFNIYAYNNQPGIMINYATGDSCLAEETADVQGAGSEYILNIGTGKFHRPDCPSAEDIKEENKKTVISTKEKLQDQGYEPCKRCSP